MQTSFRETFQSSWRKQWDSLTNSRNDNQSSKHDGHPKPPSGKSEEQRSTEPKKFVVLPHHPLYGRQVTIIKHGVAILTLSETSVPISCCKQANSRTSRENPYRL